MQSVVLGLALGAVVLYTASAEARVFFKVDGNSEAPFVAPMEDPSFVYLSWSDEDTAHTMTVHHYGKESGDTKPRVCYGEKDMGVECSAYPFKMDGFSWKIGKAPRRVSIVPLSGLKAETVYHYILEFQDGRKFGPRKFKTLPSDNSPISFVTGGDIGVRKEVDDMFRLAAETNPMFALIGGDITYANGEYKNHGRWDLWLSYWAKNMVTSEGLDIPAIVGIGNHEVNIPKWLNPFNWDLYDIAPFYLRIFHQNSKPRGHFVRKIGSDSVIYLLDTTHLKPHWEDQPKWLKKQMRRHRLRPNQMAIYHVPMYPSVRPAWNPQSWLGRVFWAPIFDKYDLDVGFENHDHAFKVTKPLRKNKVRDRGVVYVGDGNWGKSGRDVDAKRKYLHIANSESHFWSVSVWQRKFQFQAINEKNEAFFTFGLDGEGTPSF